MGGKTTMAGALARTKTLPQDLSGYSSEYLVILQDAVQLELQRRSYEVANKPNPPCSETTQDDSSQDTNRQLQQSLDDQQRMNNTMMWSFLTW